MNLESTAANLLTRDGITSILNERHLKIPNIELMGYEELLRIYETFAQPLEKRHSKRSPESVFQSPALDQTLQDEFRSKISFNEHSQVSRVFPYKSDSPYDLPPTKYLKLSFNTIPSVAKKRTNSTTITAAQEATPSKRKPITWP